MKQGNYLQVLNCTLKIKDRGRTWLGRGGGGLRKKKKSSSKRCIVISIKQTDHLMQCCWGQHELFSQQEQRVSEG